MKKIIGPWKEARLVTDWPYSKLKTIIVFCSLVLVELVAGPLLYWWFEGRKKS